MRHEYDEYKEKYRIIASCMIGYLVMIFLTYGWCWNHADWKGCETEYQIEHTAYLAEPIRDRGADSATCSTQIFFWSTFNSIFWPISDAIQFSIFVTRWP